MPELEALVEQHPLQERLRGQLMLALYRAGRQSDALAEYRRTRALLAEELGLEPSRTLQELEQAILRQDPALDASVSSAAPVIAACPFKGLAPFTVDDAEIFFGRGRVVDALVAQLASGTFAGLVGPSGCGKSSLLHAGLLRALRAGALPGSDRWEVVLLRPGDAVPAPDERTVVAVDQLEELFTGALAESERRAFLDALVALATDPRRRFSVAVALRADFYGRLAAYPDFASLLSANHVLLGAMKRDELVEAIESPAARAGLQVERQLVDALVADVEGRPGSLPLLSSALLELWQEREGSVLTEAGFRYLGGLHGAIARLAESAYGRLDEEERLSARAILLRLATEEDGAIVRRRVPLDELGADGARVLHVLTDARLLTVSRDVVEVSHEALLTEWPRLRDWLDEDRDTRKLRAHVAASAREWAERGRNREDLYRGPRLAAAAEWIETRPTDPTQLEREFVDESRAERERELARQRRRNRQLLTLLGGTALLLVLAIVAGAVAFSQRRDARRKATAALAGQVGAAAVSQPRIDLAMLLAAQAVKLKDSPQTESTLLATLLRSPSVIGEMASPIDSRPQRLVVSPDNRTVAVSDNTGTVRFYDVARRRIRAALHNFGGTQPVVYLGDGSRLAGAEWDPKHGFYIGVHDAVTLRLLRRLPVDHRFLTVPTGGNAAPVATRDGSTIFSGYDVLRPDGSDGAAYIDRSDVATGRVSVAAVGAAGIGAVGLIDGDRKLVVVGTSTATILDTRSLKPVSVVRLPPNGFPPAISPDGETVASGARNGLVTLVSLRDGTRRTTQGAHAASVGALAFSDDGRLLASASDDGTVIVWDVATGAPVERFLGHANRLLGIAFSPGDRTLWTCSLDGAIFSWDLGTSRRLETSFVVPEGTPYGVPDVDPSPALATAQDGSRFAVRSGLHVVQVRSTRTARVLTKLRLPGNVTSLALSSRASLLAVTSGKGLVELWNVDGKPRLVRRLRGLGSVNGFVESVEAVAFSPDGRYLAAGDVNHTSRQAQYRFGAVALWDVTTGRRKWLVRNRDGWVHKLAFSPDGGTLAAAQEDGRVRLFDPGSGRLERTLTLYGGPQENSGSYDTLAYGPHGLLATGGWPGIAQLWDARTGRELTTPRLAAAAPVSSLAFDPTGRLLASTGGSDGTLKLWHTPDLASFGADFPLDATQWGTAAFAPDGTRLVVLFSDGRGVVWPATVSAWLQHACAVAGRNLTRDEWARYIGTAKYEKTCG